LLTICVFIAGAETSAGSATSLLYVLASFPHVQAKGQAEIDAIIGSDRLPLVTDRAELPYVHAIVKEVSRWFTVVPLGECNSVVHYLDYRN
jgi:cytochrome P450